MTSSHNTNWMGNNNFHDNAINFPSLPSAILSDDSTEQQLYQHQQGQLQQLSDQRASSNATTLLNSSSTLQQMPVISHSTPNDGFQQQTSMPLMSHSTDGQGEVSPNFLDGMSFARDLLVPNIHLSNYPGEMLSGSYMP